MGRYDTAVRCAQIRELIEANQYLTAMEEIEELDFEKVPTITDLYLFADVFLRAEKMDAAKELYYTAYRRTASRPALYRLLMLVIRMGDIEEAKELYLAYEIIAGMTFDTYELRYRLAKAEGQPREALIQILEQLKKEEYTEEWGLQLARLYELEGMREKCIEECEDIIRWFGAGTLVNKAVELKERCMSPSWVRPVEDEIPEPEVPDLEEEPVRVAQAPVSVEEIEIPTKSAVPEAESAAPEAESETPEIREESKSPVKEERNTEENPVQKETSIKDMQIEEATSEEIPAKETAAVPEEEAETKAGVQAPVSEEREEPQEESEEEAEQRPGLFKRLVNYFKVDLDMFEEDEFPEELDTYKQQSTAELDVKRVVAESVDEIVEPKEGQISESVEQTAQMPPVGEALTIETKVVEPVRAQVESLEEKLQEIEGHKKVIQMDEALEPEPVKEVKSHPLKYAATGDIVEDVSPNGIHYNTLKGAIYKLHQEEGIINFALTGGAEGITLAVAKKLFKELKKINYFEAKNIGKISADKLDEVNLGEWAEKFIGGCMYIMEAPSLSNRSVENLCRLMDKYQKQIVIILEGSYDEMDSFLNFHKEFEKKITFKVKL